MSHIKNHKAEYIFALSIFIFFAANCYYIKKKNDEFVRDLELSKEMHEEAIDDIEETAKIIDDINEDLDHINQDLDEISEFLKNIENQNIK